MKRILASLLGWTAWIGLASAVHGQQPTFSCNELIDRGTEVLQNRPSRYIGDTDDEGRPLTEDARIFEADTKKVLAMWRRAYDVCLRDAERAPDRREASRLTAWGYWVAGESLRVQQQQADGCEIVAKGIEAVQAIDEHSPHLDLLYRTLGNCVSHYDRPHGVALYEEGLRVAIEAYGSRDARLVDSMTLLAIALPDSLTAESSPSDVIAAEQRAAELIQTAWEIVQEDPKATKEAINMALTMYCGLHAHNSACDDANLVQKELIAERTAAQGDGE